MSLNALVYASSATILLSDADLERILLNARPFNQAHNVSGILLYSEGNFIQYLEGAPQDLEAVYQRIQKDSRHHNLIELSNEMIEERHFNDWSMAFIHPSKSEILNLSSANWNASIVDGTHRTSNSEGVMLLISLWDAFNSKNTRNQTS